MGACDVPGCEGDDGLAFSCNECGDRFCSEHRLPENHTCQPLLKKSDEDRKHLESGLAHKDTSSETSMPRSQMSPREKQLEAQRRRKENEEDADEETSLAERQRESMRRHREDADDGDSESRRFEDVQDEAREREEDFRDEHLDKSGSRPWHRNDPNRGDDEEESLSPREKQIRAQERRKESERNSQTGQSEDENRGLLRRLWSRLF